MLITANVNTQDKVLNKVRKAKRKDTSQELIADEVSRYPRALYNFGVIRGPLSFCCQSLDRCPLTNLPSKVAGVTIYCTVATMNEVRANARTNQDRLETFGGGEWPPKIVADLSGC
jgi:hypothetical protein